MRRLKKQDQRRFDAERDRLRDAPRRRAVVMETNVKAIVQNFGSDVLERFMRCGSCKNCRHIAKTKGSVLAAVNPPFSGSARSTDNGQGVIDLWNRELAEHPCTTNVLTDKQEN